MAEILETSQQHYTSEKGWMLEQKQKWTTLILDSVVMKEKHSQQVALISLMTTTYSLEKSQLIHVMISIFKYYEQK